MHYVTAGESHGKMLSVIVSGVPAGLRISSASINDDLRRRRSGYGRSARQEAESDDVLITAGVRFGKTLGSPVCLNITNEDYQNHASEMSLDPHMAVNSTRVSVPRPGHADLVGALKMNTDDCRDISERASARETAARVAASGIAREFLSEFGVEIFSFVTSIGGVAMPIENLSVSSLTYNLADIECSPVRCPHADTSVAMCTRIDEARAAGETLGGTFCVAATGLVAGIGGYTSGEERLTSSIGAALFGIPAVKGVEFGQGFRGAALNGSQTQDEIVLEKTGYTRMTNRAGGLEGGMTTGLPLIVHVATKALPTLASPLHSVDMDTLEQVSAPVVRGDVCAVPATAVIAEAELAFVLAQAYMKKFGSDNMADIKAAYTSYLARLAACIT